MKLECLSPKQIEVLNWWCPTSRHCKHTAIICDGAVRSGKTLCMSLSFLLWAHFCFPGNDFALCGKTIGSLRRNLVTPLTAAARPLGFVFKQKLSRNIVEASYGGKRIRLHLFGGKDEGSAALIQGMTLTGVLFDEVALMPRSFVEQALARCSVEGSRFWFNCNPGHPAHWFHTEWILGSGKKNACYLHFTMRDNPSLSPAMLARYDALYTGVFHERYVQGKWVAAHGAVYPMFSEKTHVVRDLPPMRRLFISCDYGTVNPASFGLWGSGGDGVWYRIREYYHDSRTAGIQKTDEEYAGALHALAGDMEIEAVIVDPSAASFIECLRRRGKYPVIPAKNDVAAGIRLVGSALSAGKLRFHESCRDTIREFSLYRWNLDAQGDVPIKENDHAMDDIRYFAAHVLGGKSGGFYAVATARN
ncbi:MAG: PBSX family phage terminase large subunit [Oscillospiraceae bacterium]|nr:PBSX family phage terminase large subunit [Oscillospiraceae bacterium]